MGPFDDIRLVVESDSSFKLFVYDRVVEEGETLASIQEDNPILSKLNDSSVICCPGVPDYLSYKAAIGFDVKGIHQVCLPPGSFRSNECQVQRNLNNSQISALIA